MQINSTQIHLCNYQVYIFLILIILEYIILQGSAFVFLAQMFLKSTEIYIALQEQTISMKRRRTSPQMLMNDVLWR
jgi:hypothetical protein